MREILDNLFPAHPIRVDFDVPVDVANIPMFTEVELIKAVGSHTNRKALGSDGVSSEVLKVVAHSYLSFAAYVGYIASLKAGVFASQGRRRGEAGTSGQGDGPPAPCLPTCLLYTSRCV